MAGKVAKVAVERGGSRRDTNQWFSGFL